jgi:hypothetical protein
MRLQLIDIAPCVASCVLVASSWTTANAFGLPKEKRAAQRNAIQGTERSAGGDVLNMENPVRQVREMADQERGNSMLLLSRMSIHSCFS